MMDIEKVERVTGYIIGAVSPINQKKKSIIYIDKSAFNFNEIYISAGKRGYEIGINIKNLLKITEGRIIDI